MKGFTENLWSVSVIFKCAYMCMNIKKISFYRQLLRWYELFIAQFNEKLLRWYALIGVFGN